LSSEEDGDTATGNMYKKIREVWTFVISEICQRTDMHAYRHAQSNISHPTGDKVTNSGENRTPNN